MKTTTKKHTVTYNEFYWKMVDKIKSLDKTRQEEVSKDIEKDLEKILEGKQMVLNGNLLSM